MEPPCASMIRRQRARPRPLPLAFVVKSASKIRRLSSSGTPGPSSRTRRRAPPSALRSPSSERWPRPAIAWQAFMIRFTRTWRSWSASTSAVRPAGTVDSKVTAAGRSDASTADSTSRRRSVGCRFGGLLRARSSRSRDGLVRAPDLGADALEVLRDLRRARHLLAEVLPQEVERRLDDAERIAELVPDVGGELTDRRQPLGVPVLLDEILAIALEHDGELEIDDLVERRADPPRRRGLDRPRAAATSSKRTRIRFMAVNMNCWGRAMRTWTRPMRARTS